MSKDCRRADGVAHNPTSSGLKTNRQFGKGGMGASNAPIVCRITYATNRNILRNPDVEPIRCQLNYSGAVMQTCFAALGSMALRYKDSGFKRLRVKNR